MTNDGNGSNEGNGGDGAGGPHGAHEYRGPSDSRTPSGPSDPADPADPADPGVPGAGKGDPEPDWREEERDLEERSASAARLFDIRRVIGVLFVVYGLLVTIAGFFVSDADLAKAQDVNINLWAGLSMLVLGLLFLLWLRLSPTVPPPSRREAEGGDPGGAPPAGE
ncbi:hypothetical protein SAMN05192584_101125 [Streptomyces pini]|uniref:Uncharacterized protein n=1 Tax=Streptomyces pini TaxID=1520580 RepID=A0A1I3TW96_9ACTN|nr:hypothetical protein SAMN05192584_101125 [Streptomyces pini]